MRLTKQRLIALIFCALTTLKQLHSQNFVLDMFNQPHLQLPKSGEIVPINFAPKDLVLFEA